MSIVFTVLQLRIDDLKQVAALFLHLLLKLFQLLPTLDDLAELSAVCYRGGKVLGLRFFSLILNRTNCLRSEAAIAFARVAHVLRTVIFAVRNIFLLGVDATVRSLAGPDIDFLDRLVL